MRPSDCFRRLESTVVVGIPPIHYTHIIPRRATQSHAVAPHAHRAWAYRGTEGVGGEGNNNESEE